MSKRKLTYTKWRISDIMDAFGREGYGDAKNVAAWLRRACNSGHWSAFEIIRHKWFVTIPRIVGRPEVTNDDQAREIEELLVEHAIRLKVPKRAA